MGDNPALIQKPEKASLSPTSQSHQSHCGWIWEATLAGKLAGTILVKMPIESWGSGGWSLGQSRREDTQTQLVPLGFMATSSRLRSEGQEGDEARDRYL